MIWNWYIHIKKAREPVSSLIPLFEAFALPNQVERAMQSPTPICIYVTTESALCSYEYNMGILHTLGHLPLQCSLTWFRSCEVLKRQEQSVDKRLFHMSVSPTLPPSREGFGARNGAKIQFNYELQIMNYEEFCGICWRTQIQGQFTIYKVQFIGWFVRRWCVETFIRWRVDALSSRSKVKSQRLKSEGSRFQAISHHQQPLPLRDMLSWPNKIAPRVKQDSYKCWRR